MKRTRTPKARKTYVCAFYGINGYYTQRYFQNHKEALKFQASMKRKKEPCNLTYWIDGAEMVRLARLGYVYDSELDKCVRSRNTEGFVQEVDAMPENKRNTMFMDYRKFKTLEQVLQYREEKGVKVC